MKSAEVQSFTILKQAFFKKEFKVRLPDQLLKQTHFSSEMKVHDFCQVFLGFILQFTLCNSEWFWASHFSLQQPPAVGTRPDTICSVTSSKPESQQRLKIPTSHGTSWSIYINHYCGHLSRFHKSFERVTSWYLNTPNPSSLSKANMKCDPNNGPTVCYGSGAHCFPQLGPDLADHSYYHKHHFLLCVDTASSADEVVLCWRRSPSTAKVKNGMFGPWMKSCSSQPKGHV